MKARWREHEMVLISMIAAILICGYVTEAIRLLSFKSNALTNSSSHFFTQVLLPQIGSVLILWLSYLWMNRLIVSIVNSQRTSVLKYLGVALQLFFISYLIGPATNMASYYINPVYNRNPYDLPLVFGSHPQPMLNTFGGWDTALFVMLLYILYAVLREATIWWYGQIGRRKGYTIQISNEATLFMVVFFTAEVFIGVFNLVTDKRYYHFFNAYILPIGAVFLTNKYWLFPLKGNRYFYNWQVTGPILFSTFIYTLLFSVALGEVWSWSGVLINWALQLFIITPASWLDYQQRADKIKELRGAETALVKSKADLQLLRMQINPHFLFNVLNTLYGTALIEGSSNTAEGIQKLGDMMRFMLHENTRDDIAMYKETNYLKNYISLQKLRTQLSPDIVIEDKIEAEECNYRIAPMLLIPLVENAFKHGVDLAKKSRIKIHLECADNILNFEVRNSTHTLTGNDPEKESSGIGLQNVESRLQLLYAGNYKFTYGLQGSEFVAQLTIQF